MDKTNHLIDIRRHFRGKWCGNAPPAALVLVFDSDKTISFMHRSCYSYTNTYIIRRYFQYFKMRCHAYFQTHSGWQIVKPVQNRCYCLQSHKRYQSVSLTSSSPFVPMVRFGRDRTLVMASEKSCRYSLLLRLP